jgi:hypothetical protein
MATGTLTAPGPFRPLPANAQGGLTRAFGAPQAPPTVAPPPMFADLRDGASSEPGLGQPSGDAPAITNDSPVSLGGMVTAPFGGGKLSSGAANLGLALGGMAAGVPTSVISMPVLALGLLSQLAHRMGLEGKDPSGLSAVNDPANAEALAAMNVTPDTMGGLMGGLPGGTHPDMQMAQHGFGQSPAPSGNDPAANAAAGLAAGLAAAEAEAGGVPGGTPGEDGDDSGIGVFRRGGTVRKTGPATVHEGEEVVRASEARRVRPALKAINRPGAGGLERMLQRMT